MQNIAILVAMGMEAERLIARIEGARPESRAGAKFLRGRIGGAEVVLHVCGWGLRNADRGARALIENYRPDALVNYGVSGGLTPEIGIADTVIVTSSLPTWGAAWKAGVPEATDGALTALGARALPGARVGPAAVSKGIIVNKKRKARIAAATGALCVDMESYAIARAANAVGVPPLVIRAMSDTYEPASLLRFFRNGAAAAEKAAADTEAVIKAMAEGGA